MQLTKNRLRQIIKEELSRVIREQDGETNVSGVDLSDRYAFNSLSRDDLANLLIAIGLTDGDESQGLSVQGLGRKFMAARRAFSKIPLADRDRQNEKAVTLKMRVGHSQAVLDDLSANDENYKMTGQYPAGWAEPVYATMEVVDTTEAGIPDDVRAAISSVVDEFNSQNNGLGGLVRYGGQGQIRFRAGDGVSDFPPSTNRTSIVISNAHSPRRRVRQG
jgi:hypothetical protein